MENEITTSVKEVDTKGGWLVTHWTTTWDTRVPLASIQADIDAIDATIAEAQTKKAELVAKKEEFAAEVAAAEAAAAIALEAKKNDPNAIP